MMYVGVLILCASNIAQSCQLKSKQTAYTSQEQCLTEVSTIVGNMSEMGVIGTGTCLQVSKGEAL